jgi:predicted  nucleic acid-binding Zn-ribbon protein
MQAREHAEEVEELQDRQSRLEADISELEDTKQELVDNTEAEKERMRESVAGL